MIISDTCASVVCLATLVFGCQISMCAVFLSTGTAVVSKQPGQLPQRNGGIAAAAGALLVLAAAPSNRTGWTLPPAPIPCSASSHTVSRHTTSSVTFPLVTTNGGPSSRGCPVFQKAEPAVGHLTPPSRSLPALPLPQPHCVANKKRRRVLLEERVQALNSPEGRESE